MKAIVGLGNPGRRYEGTRHNLGFMVVEAVARRPGAHAAGAAREQFESLVTETTLGNERCLLVKPQTYMNLSGQAVQPLLAWFKIEPADCLVICDDLNLPVGRLRFRAGGSSGGHHGLEDIEKRLGRQDYPRLRIGLGLPAGWVVESFVLGKFSGEELKAIEPAIQSAAEGVEVWATKGVNAAANRFNPSPKPKRPDSGEGASSTRT